MRFMNPTRKIRPLERTAKRFMTKRYEFPSTVAWELAGVLDSLSSAEDTSSASRRRHHCELALAGLLSSAVEAHASTAPEGYYEEEMVARKRFMNVCSFAARIQSPTLKGLGSSRRAATCKFGRNKRTGECLKSRRKKKRT